MILPVYAYGQPVLKKEAEEIDKNYPELQELIANMWETMYNAKGIGLAAPQIGRSIRLFLIDSTQSDDEAKAAYGVKKVFINAEIIEEDGEEWPFEEGCLSIPDIHGDVWRPERVRIQYYDENFKFYDEVYEGINARVIQHEYDHIEGILFTELLKPLKRRLMQKRLNNIRKGKIKSNYRMRFVTKR